MAESPASFLSPKVLKRFAIARDGSDSEQRVHRVFTFMNKLSTTRATPHGPLTVVDRKGTTTVYLNPAGGASFENPATPVALAVPRERSRRLTVASPAWLSLGRGGVTIFTVN